MSPIKLADLIQKGMAGCLTQKEQLELAVEAKEAHWMAIKLERIVHKLIKDEEDRIRAKDEPQPSIV